MDLTLKRRIGGVVWCLGLVVALAWGGLRGATVEAPGVGWAPPVHVSSLEVGRVASLDVDLHDVVSADQVVARLDPTQLEAERAVVAARLLAAQEEEVYRALSESRRFAQGLEGHLIERATLSARLHEDRATLSALEERVAIEEGLLPSGATSAQAVLELRRQMRVVQARIAAGEEAMRVTSQASTAAGLRRDQAPAENQWTVVAVARELEALDARVAELELLAGIEGQVTALYAAAGEVVQPGQPLLQVTRTATDEVLGWLPASATGVARPGGSARVVRANGQVVGGTLVSVGTGPQPLPTSLLFDPRRVEYGIPVRVRLEGGAVGPEEPVRIQL